MGLGNVEFKSKSMEYETPNEIFNPLKEEFDLQLDVCSSKLNYKLDNHYTKEDDSMTKNWDVNFWMNPPFGRAIKNWVIKAHDESKKNNVTGVLILPVRCNTQWWHKYIIDAGAEVRFIKGEVKFVGHKRGLWLPFAIVIFHSSPFTSIKSK